MKHDWQGIVYMMLYHLNFIIFFSIFICYFEQRRYSGFDTLRAVQDAITAGRFSLVITMLNKIQDDKVVQGLSKKNQNLLHYLAKNSQSSMIIVYY